MNLIQFAKQKFQEHGSIPEYVEVAYDLYQEFAEYALKNFVSDFLGSVVTFSLKLPKGQAKLYFEDDLEIYQK